MKIYVGVVSYGCYDEHEEKIIYVGTDYADAANKCRKFNFPIKEQEYAQVETWEDGLYITYNCIID